MTRNPARTLLCLLPAAAVLLSLAACGGSGGSSADPAQTALREPLPEGAIPFDFDHHLWFEATVDDTLRCNLIFDTGDTFLFLDSTFYATRIGPAASLPDINLQGVGNGSAKMKADFGRRHTCRIGDVSDTTSTLTIVGDLRRIMGYRADGIFGMEFMQGRKAEFNFSRRYLRLLPDDRQPDSTYTRLGSGWLSDDRSRLSVPLRLRVGEEVVEGDFLLDMGCGRGLMLTSSAAREHRLDECTPRGLEYHAHFSGLGSESASRIFVADSLGIGPWRLPRVEAEFSRDDSGALGGKQPYIGLLGTEILSRFDLIIDFASGEMWLRPGREFDAEPPRYGSRISLTDRRDLCDGWIVSGFIEGCPAREAGLDYGDTILQVNGRSPQEFPDDEWERMLSQPGPLTLTVKRGGGTQRIESRMMETPY